MSQRSSMGIIFILVSALAISAWVLTNQHETDVYIASMKQFDDISPVLFSFPSRCHIQSTKKEGVDNELLVNFFNANSEAAKPISLSRLKNQYAIADNMALYLNAGVSKEVLISKDRPTIGLSRVGFSADGTEALFCGTGSYGSILFHLRLADGHWQEIDADPHP